MTTHTFYVSQVPFYSGQKAKQKNYIMCHFETGPLNCLKCLKNYWNLVLFCVVCKQAPLKTEYKYLNRGKSPYSLYLRNSFSTAELNPHTVLRSREQAKLSKSHYLRHYYLEHVSQRLLCNPKSLICLARRESTNDWCPGQGRKHLLYLAACRETEREGQKADVTCVGFSLI